MIKVAMTIGCLDIGGAEMFVLNLLRRLDYTKYRVLLIVLSEPRYTFIEKEIGSLPVKIRYLYKKAGFRPWVLLKQTIILMRFAPHIIHGNVGGMIYSLFYLIIFPKRRAVHTAHTLAGVEYGLRKRKILSRLYRRGQVIPVAISPTVKESIMETYHLPAEKVILINNGIDATMFKGKPDCRNDKIIIGHVGRFETVKNHETILKIYENLHQQKLQLWLIGEGSLLSAMKAQAKGLNDVYFLGSLENVFDYLARMDIFLMPSVYEGMPLALMEAMACGAVIIASRVGGIPDIVEEGINGFLIDDCYDVEGFSNIIKKLLVNKREINEISLRNIAKGKKYDIKLLVQAYEKLYVREGTYVKR